MRGKRFLSALLVLCILLSLVGIMPVSAAATEYVYRVEVFVCNRDDAGSKSGKIKTTLKFGDVSKETNLNNVTNKNDTAYAEFTEKYLPWTLTELTLKNNCKNSLWMHSVTVKVKKKGDNSDDAYKTILTHYYGTKGNTTTGKPIDKNDGGPQSRSLSIDSKRTISNLDNFSSKLNKTYHLSPSDSSKTSETIGESWSGYVTDDYSKQVGKYYYTAYADAPKLALDVSGNGGDKLQVTKYNLTQKAGFTEYTSDSAGGKNGYSVNKGKLVDYMNKNNINKITLKYTVTFPSSNTKGTTQFTAETNFVRDTFSIESVSYGKNYYNAGKNNYFYNSSQNKITVTGSIKTSDNYEHFANEALNGKVLYFDKAYLSVGGKELVSSAKQVNLSKGKSFTLDFTYDAGTDSANNGITFKLDNARVGETKESSGTVYKIWDENSKTSPTTYSKYSSEYKIDAKAPGGTVTADGTDLTKWNKTAKLLFKPDEDIYISSGNVRKQSWAKLKLLSGTSSVNIYNPMKNISSGSSSDSWEIAASGGNNTTIFLNLKDKTEGEFDIMLEGEDFAGNKLSKKFTGIKLDNQAPRVTVSRSQKEGAGECIFDIKLEDKSNTARIYYMFTKKHPSEIDKNYSYDATHAPSGEMTSLEECWAYIDQSDIQSGGAGAAYLSVEKGKNFNGYFVYIAIDQAGNETEFMHRTVNVTNEDSAYQILPSDVDVPAPSYNIKVITNENNKALYRWKRYGANGGMEILTDYKAVTSEIDTSADDTTSKFDGLYIFELELTMPSGTKIYPTKEFVFDNSGPEIKIETPQKTSFLPKQTVYVYADDRAEVASATAETVSPTGDVYGQYEKTELIPENGTVKHYAKISEVNSGAYALKITAVDTNGHASEKTSDLFFIRKDKPEGTVKIESDLTYNESPLSATNDIKLSFDVKETFENSAYAGKQLLYYRVGTASDEYGEWISAGEMTADENGFSANLNGIKIPSLEFMTGENTLYVQTAICPENGDAADIRAENVKSDELTLFYDDGEPSVMLIIEDDVYTTESIIGKIAATDDFGGTLTAECDDENVKVGAFSGGFFEVTVSENVDTVVRISDEAGNTSELALKIDCIDREAPTASMTAEKKTVGARTDAEATIQINDAFEGSVKFALIPVGKYDGGSIPEEYFIENLPESIHTRLTGIRSDRTDRDGEKNLIYKLEIAGECEESYVGVRAEDSLGNGADIVFTDKGEIVSSIDAKLEMDYSVSPKTTETKTVVTAKFNVPASVLPQDKIVTRSEDADADELGLDLTGMNENEKLEAINCELAREYATAYSEKTSIVVTKHGTYDLYAADDLNRVTHFTAKVTEDDVTFGVSANIKATVVKKEGDDYVPLEENEWASAVWSDYQYAVIVEFTGDDNEGMLLLPGEDLIDYIDHSYWYRKDNGLYFDVGASGAYAVGADGNAIENPYDTELIKGYTKLVYEIEQLENSGDEGGYSDATERIFSVYAVNSEETVEKSLLVTNIDNNGPKGTQTVTPDVLTYDEDWNEIRKPTPGDVTYTITVQDKETGIGEIVALSYYDFDGNEYLIPEEGFDINTEYWCWDGNEQTLTWHEYDEELEEYVEKTGSIPVKIEYFGEGDKYSEKTLVYTFSDEFDLSGGEFGGFGCINSLGAMSEISSELKEYYGMSTVGLIYKLPIEEGKDYKVKYFFENASGDWEEVTEFNEDTYFKYGKAEIEILSRGEERGLYVANNGGKTSKELNTYQNTYDFKLRDKYGYEATRTVELDNFDITPGDFEYYLSTTANTNEDITLTVYAYDDESGVGRVVLKNGSDEMILTENSGVYTGKISKNGTYGIVMYDNVGNRTAKNFNVQNINTEAPSATVMYYCGNKTWAEGEEPEDFYTSRTVTATLSFSKPNVKIIGTEPVAPLTSEDYSVDYGSSEIVFTKSGTMSVYYRDDYGNEGDGVVVTVGNIDKTPPRAEPVINNKYNFAEVTFEKLTDLGSERDIARKESEIYVSYGGIVKAIANEDGSKNGFEFSKNGNYTFKVYDGEGLSSYVDVEITGIDTKAPKITKVAWSYDYEEYDEVSREWKTHRVTETKIPTDGTTGYRVASDENSVTNQDVTVTVETDSETKLLGGDDEYTTVKEKVYDSNGMFVFNTEKKNGLKASYGVDIEIIDKTPPVIDLGDAAEVVFYENPKMGSEYSKDVLTYTAYDIRNGIKTDLTDKVEIDWGGFDADNLYNNTFDSSKPYTITYTVSDSAHNTTSVKRTVRLVGMYDTVALVNGSLPSFNGTATVEGDKAVISLKNFSGTVYARYMPGVYTMGQMKKTGTMLEKNQSGEFELGGLSTGWYTFYIQTDKRDYFTLKVFVIN